MRAREKGEPLSPPARAGGYGSCARYAGVFTRDGNGSTVRQNLPRALCLSVFSVFSVVVRIFFTEDRGLCGLCVLCGDRMTGIPYPADTYRRLRAVKADVDPGELFRATHAIPPADRA